MKIQRNIKLAKYTTFHTGGPAKYFAEIKNIRDLREALGFAKKHKLKLIILGGGSNILLPDKGLNKLVLVLSIRNMSFDIRGGKGFISAGAGQSWDRIVATAVKRGLGGLENLSLIPGTLGGAIYQNIGAYGVELKDILESVDVFDINEETVKTLSNPNCNFGYRDSIFQSQKGKNYIIIGGVLRLLPGSKPKIDYPDLAKYFKNKIPTTAEIRNAIIKIRREKLDYPTDSIGTAGSFFKNPVITLAKYSRLTSDHPDIKGWDIGYGLIKIFAGQLTEKAGWKGKRLGNAGVSTRHAMVLVSYRGAKSKDIFALAKKMQTSVKAKFGISLEPEVKIIA